MNIFGFKAKRTGFKRFKMIHDSTLWEGGFQSGSIISGLGQWDNSHTLCEKEKDKNS